MNMACNAEPLFLIPANIIPLNVSSSHIGPISAVKRAMRNSPAPERVSIISLARFRVKNSVNIFNVMVSGNTIQV